MKYYYAICINIMLFAVLAVYCDNSKSREKKRACAAAYPNSAVEQSACYDLGGPQNP